MILAHCTHWQIKKGRWNNKCILIHTTIQTNKHSLIIGNSSSDNGNKQRSQIAHMAPVYCHFKMPLLPAINCITILWDFLKTEDCHSIGRRDYCKHVHVSVSLAATPCDVTYVSAQSTLHRRPTWLVVKLNKRIVFGLPVYVTHSYTTRWHGSARLVEAGTMKNINAIKAKALFSLIYWLIG